MDASVSTTNLTVCGSDPFDRLPVELVIDIFLHVVAAPPSRQDPTIIDEIWNWTYVDADVWQSPLILASICRRWRHFAITTPQLWKVLVLQFTGQATDIGHEIELLQEWLDRLGPAPFELRIPPVLYAHDMDHSQSDLLQLAHQLDIADRLSEMIASVIHRCVALHLGMRHCQLLQIKKILDALILHNSNLEQLYFYTQDPSDLIDLSTCDQLQSVVCQSMTSYRRINFTSRQQNNLRCLQLAILLNELCNILEQFPALTQCTFTVLSVVFSPLYLSVGEISAPTGIDRQPLVLPHLQMLSLDMTLMLSVTHLVDFFDRLTLPVLQSYTFRFTNCLEGFEDASARPVIPSIFSMLIRSCSSLQFLSLNSTFLPIIENELIECLSALPTLKCLDIFLDTFLPTPFFWNALRGQVFSTEELESDLAEPHIDSHSSALHIPICPILEHLTIDSRRSVWPAVGLIEMALSRFPLVERAETSNNDYRTFRHLEMMIYDTQDVQAEMKEFIQNEDFGQRRMTDITVFLQEQWEEQVDGREHINNKIILTRTTT